MKFGYNVKVSDSPMPKFPSNCVVCGEQHGGEYGILEMTPKAHIPFVWFFTANMIKVGEKWHILQIPAHKSCISRLRRNFWLRYLLLVLIVLPTAIVGIMNNWQKVYSGLLVCVIVAPFIYWDLTHPMPVEYEHDKGDYTFTFKSRAYAESFADLNQSTIEGNR